MALDNAQVKELLLKLEADRIAYFDTLARTQEQLSQTLTTFANIPSTSNRILDRPPIRSPTSTTAPQDVDSYKKGSTFTGDDDDSSIDDDNESLFVQQPLPPDFYDEAGLCEHIRNYKWDQFGKKILDSLVDIGPHLENGNINLFPAVEGPVEDRSHLTHHQNFDIGADGAPLLVRKADENASNALKFWKNAKSLNADPKTQRQAVGRITIIREPSPMLFAALHYALNKHFDMDEVFRLLADNRPSRAIMNRAFEKDERRQRSFLFNFEYFTLIGDDCKPMKWQQSDDQLRGSSKTHLPITRCSSVTALSLSGPPISSVKSRERKSKGAIGHVFDPFAPWRLLSVQCYPDWKSSLDSHDSTKHYVNGPEAFMVTLRAEFRDAQKRMLEIYRRINTLVSMPAEYLFKEASRDKLLFEDANFTYSRRYFWAYQTLGVLNDNIQAICSSYKNTFTDDVWNGRNKIIWPGTADQSSRHAHWRKKMNGLRKDMEYEIDRLEEIIDLNIQKQKDIDRLREYLFSGTSVLESRKSVDQAVITVNQGHNIKLLTLITIFFLPLTFVTSVFGMTNMPQEHNFVPFAIVTVVICVPTYLLIGSLNTTEGLKFWQELFAALFKHPANAIVRLAKLPGKIFYPDVSRASSRRGSMSSLYAESIDSDYDQKPERLRHRSQSAMNAIAARTGKMPVTRPRTDTMETGKSAEELSKLGELQAKSPDRSDATVRFHGVANNSQAGIQEKTDEMDSQESKADGTTGMKIDGRTVRPRKRLGMLNNLFRWSQSNRSKTAGTELC